MRVFILSDVHVDFEENRKWVQQLSDWDFKNDILILAGDITHDFDLLRIWLLKIRRKFAELFFVPGNHDLWIRGEDWANSLEKFKAIMEFCRLNEIEVQAKVFTLGNEQIRIIPVFSWYNLQEEKDTLYLPKIGEDATNRMWSDNYYVHWPKENRFDPTAYFLEYSNHWQPAESNEKIITFSHFLPRHEVMFSGEMSYDPERMRKHDRFPQFNFSRVAGSLKIDRFIRKLGATIHIYGHQHINRDKTVDGVRYLSHCLGYPEERRRGMVKGIENGPKVIMGD